jgi:hypothetical protein
MKLSLPPKIGGKTSLGPSYLFPFVKFSFPVTRLMPSIMLKLAVHRLTLQITLISGLGPSRPLFIVTMAITAVMGPLLLQVGR